MIENLDDCMPMTSWKGRKNKKGDFFWFYQVRLSAIIRLILMRSEIN